jgi:hypothetical protein
MLSTQEGLKQINEIMRHIAKAAVIMKEEGQKEGTKTTKMLADSSQKLTDFFQSTTEKSAEDEKFEMLTNH